MPGDAKLKVTAGPCAGREYSIPAGGRMRAGRSSSNDMPLADLSVSRFHCLFFFKPGEGLFVADLGSANQTLVNGGAVQEQKLNAGDFVTLGDSVISVVSNGSTGEHVPPIAAVAVPVAAPQSTSQTLVSEPVSKQDASPLKLVKPVASAPPVPPVEPVRQAPVVDLGLAAKPVTGARPKMNKKFLVVLVALALVAVIAVWVPKLLDGKGGNTGGGSEKRPIQPKTIVDPNDLYVRYEKVDGSSSNVFKYLLVIGDGKASLEVHDVVGNRHLIKPPADMSGEILVRLARDIENSGFMSLQPEYKGRTPGVYCRQDITVTIGLRNGRTIVFNAVPPDPFDSVQKMLETFGQNEFNITAFAKSREELIKLASESWELAQKVYGEKTIKHGNLSTAIRDAKTAEIYLETIDPKPGFYEEVAAARVKWEMELDRDYGDLRFQYERAANLKDWRDAMLFLRIIIETVPSPQDARNKQAQADMVNAQRYLDAK